MPVYRQSKLIHIHIPKTAGTAIESFFHSIGDMVWGLDSWLGQEYIDHRWYEFQHLSMLELLTFTADEFRYFSSFAVIRNPYSRLVSEYLWRRSIKQPGRDAKMLFFDSFREFLQEIPQEIDTNWPFHLENADQAKTNFLIHVRPQYQYVCLQNGEQVVKELLRFEQLEPEFNEFIGRHGLETNMIRTPQERSFKSYFDQDMLRRANKIYAKDFELGSYEML